MILHVSKDFAKRYKCNVGGSGQTVLQTGRFDAWSAHCFKIGRKQATMFMNDATLYAVIIPTAGLLNFQSVFAVFLGRVAMKWRSVGSDFNPLDQSAILLPRSNKSLIGSMNDAIRCITFKHEIRFDCDPDIDWIEYELGINSMPYKALKYNSPDERLLKTLGANG